MTTLQLSQTNTLCQQLVQCASVTPADHGCQHLLGSRLGALGFSLEPMRHGQVDNLWARLGKHSPLLVFAGHTDVVPTGDPASWSSPPFDATVVDGHIVGRGAADMKGSVAAMITAVERFLSSNNQFNGSMAFLLTSDEEGPAIDGTARVIEALENRGEKINYCLVGEPTSQAVLGEFIKNGRRAC